MKSLDVNSFLSSLTIPNFYHYVRLQAKNYRNGSIEDTNCIIYQQPPEFQDVSVKKDFFFFTTQDSQLSFLSWFSYLMSWLEINITPIDIQIWGKRNKNSQIFKLCCQQSFYFYFQKIGQSSINISGFSINSKLVSEEQVTTIFQQNQTARCPFGF